MESERRICCCGSRIWAKVIGWYEIVASAAGIIVMILVLANVSNAFAKIGIFGLKIEMLRQIFVHTIMLCVLSFAMGIVLVRGSCNRNSSQLRAWRIYTATWLFIFSAFCISMCFGVSTRQIIYNLIWLVVNLILYGFFIWVVGVHQNEIEASSHSSANQGKEV